MMEQPKIIFDGLVRYRYEGMRGLDWVWFVCAMQEERDEVDKWLWSIKHPLAQRSGTPESRFKAVVIEIAEKRAKEKEKEDEKAKRGDEYYQGLARAPHCVAEGECDGEVPNYESNSEGERDGEED